MSELAAIVIGIVVALLGGGALLAKRKKTPKPDTSDPTFDAASQVERATVKHLEKERDEKREALDAVDAITDADERSSAIADLAND